MAQQLAIFGVAVVFITVGLINKQRGKGPWMSFLLGGIAMAALETLNLLGIATL
jgi:hypothetical protein